MISLGALVALGCGPRVESPVDCGGDGPTRLLDLADGPDEVSVGVRRVERGWIVSAEGWTWAVECDAAPRRVFAGGLEPPPADGMPWLGEHYDLHFATGVVYFAPLDPWEDTTPERVGPLLLLGTVGGATVFALPGASHEAPDPRLLHVTYRAGRLHESTIVPVTLLHEPIEVGGPFGADSTMIEWVDGFGPGRSDRALAIVKMPDEPAGEGTVEIDLATGQARLVRAGFHASRPFGDNDRFAMLWTVDPELAPSRPLLLDRSTGMELPLGREPSWPYATYDSHMVIVASDDETHVVVLPELRELWLPGTFESGDHLVADDGAIVLQGADGWYVVRPGDDTPKLVYPELDVVCVLGNDLYVADKPTPFILAPFQPRTDPSYDLHEPLELLRIPLDGSTPTPDVVLPVPVYEVMRLAGGKWAAFVSIEGDEWEELRGELRIFDPARGTSELVAEDAMLGLSRTNEEPGLPDHCQYPIVSGAPREELVYARYGAGNDDRALWRVVP